MLILFPYRIDRRLKSVPWVTIALIALNVLGFAVELLDPEAVIGALGFTPDIRGTYTWLTAMFLHGGVIHLLGNMYFVWMFGSVVEDSIGKLRYIGLYLVGGLASALLHGLIVTAFTPEYADIPMVGASGALAAIMGVFAVRLYQTKIRFFYWFIYRIGTLSASSVWGIGLWGARELLGGLAIIGGAQSTVASWAHIGGLLMGVGGAFALGLAKEGTAGYMTEEADSYAAVGMNDIAAAKYREAAKIGAADTLDARVARARAAVGAAQGPDATAISEFRSAFEGLMQADRRDEAFMLAADLFEPLVLAGADARLLLTVAGLAEAKRDHPLALRAYDSIASAHPGTFECEKARFRYAHVLLAAGRDEEARGAWTEFTGAYPSSEWLAYADGRLTL